MSLEPLVVMESEEVFKKYTMIVLCQRNRDQLEELLKAKQETI